MTEFPSALPPVDPPTVPHTPLPPLACDAHVHMVAGPEDFPLWEGRVEDPAPGSWDTWIAQFERHLETLGFARTVIVHSILYGGDNSVTAETVQRLGTDRARGIGLVRDGVGDAELDALAASGLMGVRLNYVHGGLLTWAGARAMAPALAAREMHIQMLLFAHAHIAEIAEDIRALPVPLVIDHMGWPDLSRGLDDPGFQTLCALLAEGRIYVKLSGIYRLCNAPYDVAAPFVEALVAANPEHCLWGSDWPHLMLADAAQPDAGVLLNTFLDTVTSDAHRQAILTEAPARLFRF